MLSDAAKIGINILAVEVKDVIFPADLKRAFAETLKAKQEGQAALEGARGEPPRCATSPTRLGCSKAIRPS